MRVFLWVSESRAQYVLFWVPCARPTQGAQTASLNHQYVFLLSFHQTPSQLQSLYLAKVKSMSFPRNSYAPYGYDALWTIALALNHSIAILARTNKTLSDFNYQSNDMAAIFTRMVANTSFRGMSVSSVKHDGKIYHLLPGKMYTVQHCARTYVHNCNCCGQAY